jgi:ribosome-binding factor A
MAKENPRARRLGEQIQRELTELLRRDVKDERIGNVTITAVSVTGDLRTARVYYLVFGRDGPDPKVQRGLESAAGFLRNALSRSLMIRYTPTLSFELDTSIEHGVRLTQLIDSVIKAAAVDTGAVHTGAVHTGAVHTGAVGTGAVHTAVVDTGAVHTGAVHTGAVHTGAVQPPDAQAARDEDGHVIDAGEYVARDRAE